MWLYNALKLKKIYSFTVFSIFWWLFKVSCSFQSYPESVVKVSNPKLERLFSEARCPKVGWQFTDTPLRNSFKLRFPLILYFL